MVISPMEEKLEMTDTEGKVEIHNDVVLQLFKIIPLLNIEKQQILLKQTEEMLAEEVLLKDKRNNIRKSCSIIVDYAFNNRAFVNYIKDISAKGLFIETQQPVSVGHIITMTFSLPGFEKPLKVKGKVSRITPQGAGVKFIELSPYQEEMIVAIVDRMESL